MLEITLVLLSGGTALIALFKRTHSESEPLHKSKLGQALIVLVVASTLFQLVVGWNARRQREADRRDAEQLRAELKANRELAETRRLDLEAANQEIADLHERLKPFIGFPIPVDDDSPTGVWHGGQITLSLHEVESRVFLMGTIVSDDFDGSAFSGDSKSIKVEVVNVLPTDMVAVTVKLLERPEYALGNWPDKTGYIRHDSVVAVAAPTKSGKYVVKVDASDWPSLMEVLKRNRRAGLRITLQ